MTLVPQTVEVRLGKRDSKTSPVLSTPGTLTRAQNVSMDAIGELRRRPGSAVVTSSGIDSTFKKLAELDGTLLAFGAVPNGQIGAGTININRSTPGLASGSLDLVGSTLSARFSTEEPQSCAVASDQRSHDFCRAGGYDWHVWEDYGPIGTAISASCIRYSVFDSITRAPIIFNKPIVFATVTPFLTRPQIIAAGTKVLIAYVKTPVTATDETAAGSQIAIRSIQLAIPGTVSGETVLDGLAGTDVNGLGGQFDMQNLTGSPDVVALTYKVAGAVFGTRVRVREWNVQTFASVFGSGPDIAVTANGDIGDSALGFLKHDHADGNYYVASVCSTNAAGRTQIALHIGATGGGALNNLVIAGGSAATLESWRNVTGYVQVTNFTAHIFAERAALGPAWPTPVAGGPNGGSKSTVYYTRTSGGVVTGLGTLLNFGLASKFWGSSTTMYALVSYTSAISPTYFVAQMNSSGTALTRIFPGTAGLVDAELLERSVNARVYRPARSSKLPTPQVSGATISIAAVRMGANSSPLSPQREAYMVSVTEANLSSGLVNVADSVVIPGGFPKVFDGRMVDQAVGSIFTPLPELGFHIAPQPVEFTGNGGSTVGGNTLTLTATYRYAYIYACVDAHGRLEWSADSPVQSFTLTGTQNTITFNVSCYNVGTTKYVGSIYIFVYRSEANAGTGAPLFYRASIANPTVASGSAAQSIQFVDGTGTFVGTGEQLYTKNGTILENAPWPAIRQMTTWKNRAWGLLEENHSAYIFSKLIKPEFCLETNEDFIGVIEDAFGPLYAQSALGERFVFFKRNAVYVISGDGPADDGSGSFSDPIRLDGVPGCVNPASVVVTSEGVMYLAPDSNFWLLTFGLESRFIGQPISNFSSALYILGSNVVGSLYEPQKQKARFFSGPDAVTLEYDVQTAQWFTHTVQPIKSAIMFNGQQTYLTDTRVLKEAKASDFIFTEGGTAYEALIELAWLSLNQLAGYARVWTVTLLGRLIAGTPTLTLEMIADFGTTVTSRSLVLSAIPGGAADRIEARVPLQMQQNTALKLLIRDNSTTADGFAIDGINLQCGFAPGRRSRLPGAQVMT